MPLTPADVHNVAFSKPPIGKRGYNEDEVDAFLDLVEAELARLIEENDDLREQVSQLDQRLGQRPGRPGGGAVASAGRDGTCPPRRSRCSVRVEPPPMPQRPMEPPRGMGGPPEPDYRGRHGWRPPRPGREGPGPGPGDGRPADRRGQERGRLHAGRTPATSPSSCSRDARAKSDGLVNDARSRAETMLNDARTRAETLERQSRDKAAQLVGDAERKQTEIIGSITRDKSELEKKIDELRTFEREYRTTAQDLPGVPAARPGGAGDRGAGRRPAPPRTAGTPRRGTASGPTPAADHPTHQGGAGIRHRATRTRSESCCSWYSSSS